MKIQQYIDKKKDIYFDLLAFVESENISDDYNFENLIKLIDSQQIPDKPRELINLLQLISKLSNNHRREFNFSTKINHILLYYKEKVKQALSNFEIFKIFQNNKLILLYLFENKIITADEQIVEYILNNEIITKQNFEYTIVKFNGIKSNNYIESITKKKETKKCFHYDLFFYPEIKNVIPEEKEILIENELLKIDKNIFDSFEEKRKKGENDSYLCELIRNDSIELFIAYVNRTNYHLSNLIEESIFETNSFLIKNRPNLIEYAAFFGSIQIFQYLYFNKVELESSLWFYAIHGKNAEIIHILETNNVLPPKKSYEKCLKESIKCHHNDLANYIINNLIDKNDFEKNIINNFSENINEYSIRYFNFYFFTFDLKNKFIFYYLCEFNYIELVDLYLKFIYIDLNATIIILLFDFFHRISS